MVPNPSDETSPGHPFPESWEAGGHAHVDLDDGSAMTAGLPADARIRSAACERLRADPRIDASKIAVVVEDGEVTLSGTVLGAEVPSIAVALVREVNGVRVVHDRIEAR